jgi:transposase, IS30 family
MRNYKQLTQEIRYAISAMKQAGHNQQEISKIVGYSPSTISRELNRNKSAEGYDHKIAEALSLSRRQGKSKERISSDTWSFIEILLQDEWSPEQISGWFVENNFKGVSHEYIYQHIYSDKCEGGKLYTHLRNKKKYKKRNGGNERRGQLVDRVSIDQRPDIVDKRYRLGDWELDTIVGKKHQQAIVTITERRSGFALIKRVKQGTAKAVGNAIVKLLMPYKECVLTMTADNGKEFANHKYMAKQLEADFYFAHPYSPWERGCNENMNGLIRQYFPKGSDFSGLTKTDEQLVMNKLNNRPRKRNKFKSPNQMFFGKKKIALAC